jgi:hypothetical protein
MNITKWSDLGGASWRIRRFADPEDMAWSAFNPSVALSPSEGLWVMFRSSNYFHDPESGGTIVTTREYRVKSDIWMGKLDDNFEIIDATMVKLDFSESGIEFRRGAEDGRLFWKDGGWWFTAGLHEKNIELPRIGLFSVNNGFKVKLEKVYTEGALKDVEKNWMAIPDSRPLKFIYGPNQVYLDGRGVVEVGLYGESIKGFRGGSPLHKLPDGTYISILHRAYNSTVYKFMQTSMAYKYVKHRTYTHIFVKYSSDGAILAATPEFVFQHDGIEFAAGLVVVGDEILVSYGYKDVSSYLGKIKLKAVLSLFKDI